MTPELEEWRAFVADMRDSSFDDMRAAQELIRRANGTPVHLLLAAALSISRELRNERIGELGGELEDLKIDYDALKDEAENCDGLRAELEDLRDELRELQR